VEEGARPRRPRKAAPAAEETAEEAVEEGTRPGRPRKSPAAETADAVSQTATQAIEEAGGRRAIVRLMNQVVAAEAAGGAEAAAKLINRASRWGNVIVEYWINSILSGPITHMVNIGSNLMTMLWLPLERALGATLVGDFAIAGNQVRLIMEYFNQVGSAFKMATKAAWNDEDILEQGLKTLETGADGRAISARGMGMSENSIGGQAANWIGKLLNLPSRMLSAEDEFFKQLHYRAHFKSKLQIEGLRRFGSDTKAAARWAEDMFSNVLENGQMYSELNMTRKASALADEKIASGAMAPEQKIQFVSDYMKDSKNWDKQAGLLSKESLDEARYATFTTPLLPGQGPITSRVSARIQAIAGEAPVIRFMLPFIRTPTNLLNFALQRLPITNLQHTGELLSLLRKEATMADRNRRAVLAGRLAFGMGVTATAVAAATSGTLTGGGPTDRNRRELWEQTGWRPYSIKVGDKYISYRRFDPFASLFGLVADAVEMYQDAVRADDKLDLDEFLLLTVYSMSRNITNKTYLTGVTNFANAVSDPEQYGSMLINSLAGGMVPFSGMVSNSINLFTDDPVQREVRGLIDAMKSRIPVMEQSVAPRRNMFGEEIKKANRPPSVLSFLPVEYTTEIDDPIINELKALNHGFTRPSHIRNKIDLTLHQTAKGQQAYDRWLELHGQVKIRGLTLRESLTRLMRNRSYQRLSPESSDEYDSPRIRIIRSVISQYRDKAYQEMLKEVPELKEIDRIHFMNRQALRRGASIQELQSLVRN
jgi:hypothetical protein